MDRSVDQRSRSRGRSRAGGRSSARRPLVPRRRSVVPWWCARRGGGRSSREVAARLAVASRLCVPASFFPAISRVVGNPATKVFRAIARVWTAARTRSAIGVWSARTCQRSGRFGGSARIGRCTGIDWIGRLHPGICRCTRIGRVRSRWCGRVTGSAVPASSFSSSFPPGLAKSLARPSAASPERLGLRGGILRTTSVASLASGSSTRIVTARSSRLLAGGDCASTGEQGTHTTQPESAAYNP